MPAAAASPCTLAIDCGGTGLKASVLDAHGRMLTERVRVLVQYPTPPEALVAALVELVSPLPPYERVAVGFPGMVRGGVVLATPHYVTTAGPYSAPSPELVSAWAGYDVQSALAKALGKPTRVVNDAEMQGAAVVTGKGFEMVLTIGTGLGCALFDAGRLLPKIELSQHPMRKGLTYDEYIGDRARREIGNKRWSRRVARVIETVRPVFWPDRLYLGGGATKHLMVDLGPDVVIVPNTMGIMGGAYIWEH